MFSTGINETTAAICEIGNRVHTHPPQNRTELQKFYLAIQPHLSDFSISGLVESQTLHDEGVLDGLGDACDMTTRFADNLEICAEWARQADALMQHLKATLSFGDDADMGEIILSRLESALICIWTLTQANNAKVCIGTLSLYAKTWLGSKSITTFFLTKATDLIRKMYSDPQLKNEGWLRDNLDLITEGSLGEHLAELINLLILTGACPRKHENLLGNEVYSLLKVPQRRGQNRSVLKLFVNSSDWVLSSVIPALVTQNYGLLLSSEETLQLDQSYIKVMDMANRLVNNEMKYLLEKYDVTTDAQVIVALVDCIAMHEVVLQTCKDDKAMKSTCVSRILRMDKVCSEITSKWKEKPIREQPFSQLIVGGSSVAKSSLVTLANHVVSRVNKFPEGNEYEWFHNAMDEYQSGFTSRVLTAFIDDLCNTRADREKTNPLFIIIQFSNNMHCAALSPIAEEKGKNDIRVKQMYATTNKEDLSASWWTVNVVSIMRRFNLIVDVRLKPEAVNENGEILSKYENQRMPDIWILDVSRVRIMRAGATKDTWEKDYILKNAGVREYVNLLAEVTPPWYKRQERVVDNATDLHKAPHCHKHPLFILPCLECAQQECEETWEPPDLQNEGTPGADEDEWKDPLMEGMEKLFGIERVTAIASLKTTDFSEQFVTWKKIALEHAPKIVTVGVIVGAGFAACSMLMGAMESEGALISFEKTTAPPKALAEKQNAWKKIYSNMKDYPVASTTSTPETVQAKIEKNQSVIAITEMDPMTREKSRYVRYCNIVPYRHAQWIIPNHELEEGVTYYVEVRTAPEGTLGVKFFNAVIDESCIHRDPAHNLALIQLLQGGDTADFRKYVPITRMLVEGDFVRHYYRPHETIAPGSEYHEVVESAKTVRAYNEGEHNVQGDIRHGFMYDMPTRGGMCGSTLWLANRNMTLVGMHTAGDGKKGAAVFLSREVLDPLEFGGIKVTETTALPSRAQCKDVPLTGVIHSHNPMHYIPEDEEHCCEMMGAHSMPRSKFSSNVRDSCIRKEVEEAFGVCEHTAPLKKSATPARRKALLAVTEPLEPLIPRTLKAAVKDFKTKIDLLCEANQDFLDYCHTIDLGRAINGEPGVHGFDSVNPKTSMSHPWNCPKRKLFVQNVLAEALGIKTNKILCEKRNGEFVYEFVFDEKQYNVRDSVEGLMVTMLNGERPNVVFKTNLKDEPVKWEKIAENKIRVFSGAQFDFVVLTRMVTLPTINAMTYYPEVFESAVGANALGKDWQYLHDIATKFGAERCFAGDFSKFDQKLRANVLVEAFGILRHILEKAGASEETLSLLDGIASECSFPVYDLEGAIFKAFGSSPSGHALTVVINGICNVLLLRYVYYTLHFERLAPLKFEAADGTIPLFHEVISALVLGDDNVGSVSEEEPLFNQLECSRILGAIGMPYTDASKGVVAKPFVTVHELDFLKRSFADVAPFSGKVGILAFESILKMLCVVSRGRDKEITEAQLIASAAESARSEMALRGEDELAQFDAKLLPILRNARDADGCCPMDYMKVCPFSEYVQRYEDTYSVYGTLPLPECLKLQNQGASDGAYWHMKFKYELGEAIARRQDYTVNPTLPCWMGECVQLYLDHERHLRKLPFYPEGMILDVRKMSLQEVIQYPDIYPAFLLFEHVNFRFLDDNEELSLRNEGAIMSRIMVYPSALTPAMKKELGLTVLVKNQGNTKYLEDWFGPLVQDALDEVREEVGSRKATRGRLYENTVVEIRSIRPLLPLVFRIQYQLEKFKTQILRRLAYRKCMTVRRGAMIADLKLTFQCVVGGTVSAHLNPRLIRLLRKLSKRIGPITGADDVDSCIREFQMGIGDGGAVPQYKRFYIARRDLDKIEIVKTPEGERDEMITGVPRFYGWTTSDRTHIFLDCQDKEVLSLGSFPAPTESFLIARFSTQLSRASFLLPMLHDYELDQVGFMVYGGEGGFVDFMENGEESDFWDAGVVFPHHSRQDVYWAVKMLLAMGAPPPWWNAHWQNHIVSFATSERYGVPVLDN